MSPDQAVNPFMQMAFPAIILFFIFYFIVLKPEKSKQQERKQMLSNIKKNDEVVTLGGIHGTIVNIKPATVILGVDDNVKIEVDKEAVISVTSQRSST